MTRTSIVLLALACAPAAARADLVSASLAPSPAGILSIDIFFDSDNTPGTAWTAAGIRAVAQNGAAIRYSAPGVIINPGLADLNVVALSKPLPQGGPDRFTNSGAALAGRYDPTGPTPTATAAELNVAYFASPPATSTTPGVDGFIARIGLDVSALMQPNSAFGIFTPGSQPAGSILVLLSSAATGPGTVFTTFNQPQTRGINWGVYVTVPAPGSLALLAGAGILSSRRRRPVR